MLNVFIGLVCIHSVCFNPLYAEALTEDTNDDNEIVCTVSMPDGTLDFAGTSCISVNEAIEAKLRDAKR